MESLLKKRRKSVENAFKTEGFSGFFTSDIHDIYYFTGLSLSRGFLFFFDSETTLVVDGRYIEKAKKLAKINVLLEKNETLKECFSIFTDQKIGINYQKISAHIFCDITDRFQCKAKLTHSLCLDKVRAIKDSSEIKKMQEGLDIAIESYKHGVSLLVDGVSEKEIALEIEYFAKKAGADEMSFPSIVAFGKNGQYPHYEPSQESFFRKGDAVLIDMGVLYKGVATDMTRCICNDESQPLYAAVKAAYNAAFMMCREGMLLSEVDKAARVELSRFGYEEYFTHGLGHGIGCEVHEFPSISSKSKDITLKEGMVFTIEPGVYIPSLGGVRYENMCVMKNGKAFNLLREDF